MSLRINSEAPNFTAETTQGTIEFHNWIGDSWAILFSHPKDFTPVCTTEFGAVAQLAPDFEKRKTKVIGVSVDNVQDHDKWKRDIEAFAGAPANFPIIDDTSLTVSKAYDMLPADFYLPTEGRTPARMTSLTHTPVIWRCSPVAQIPHGMVRTALTLQRESRITGTLRPPPNSRPFTTAVS